METNTTKANMHRSKIYYNIKLTQKTKGGSVASYNLWTGNGTGLFWKE